MERFVKGFLTSRAAFDRSAVLMQQIQSRRTIDDPRTVTKYKYDIVKRRDTDEWAMRVPEAEASRRGAGFIDATEEDASIDEATARSEGFIN